MSTPAKCQLVGHWQIVEADIWDRDYLDLCGRATMTITKRGHGEIAFGARQAGLDIDYSGSSIDFTWRASTKWMRSPETVPPNSSTTVP
jgi:hypothetical protein